MYTKIDTLAERKRLEHIIDNYEPQEFQCSYNLYTGKVDCLESCVSRILDHVQCPDERFFKAERDLSLLNTRPLMKLVFSNPNLAASNDFLKEEGIVHSHADVLGKLNEWHCSELRELRFRGIIISEGWRISAQPMLLSLTVTILLIIVVAAKFTFYDWGTAWNIGCFFATLTTIPWIWAHVAV
ncbi:hypothetical protein N7522_001956 [Penicillium canescens]|nr:hypothetical protein N7522_001956 [Penicillium canescens]